MSRLNALQPFNYGLSHLQSTYMEAASEIEGLRAKLTAQQDLCFELTNERDNLAQTLRETEVSWMCAQRKHQGKMGSSLCTRFIFSAAVHCACGSGRRQGPGPALSANRKNLMTIWSHLLGSLIFMQ